VPQSVTTPPPPLTPAAMRIASPLVRFTTLIFLDLPLYSPASIFALVCVVYVLAGPPCRWASFCLMYLLSPVHSLLVPPLARCFLLSLGTKYSSAFFSGFCSEHELPLLAGRALQSAESLFWSVFGCVAYGGYPASVRTKDHLFPIRVYALFEVTGPPPLWTSSFLRPLLVLLCPVTLFASSVI